MAELSTLARPYAQALFQVAQQSDLEGWAALVNELAAVAGNPDMSALMIDPKISDEQLYQVFAGVLKTPLHATAQNFLRELIANGRLSVMSEIAQQFKQLKNAHENLAEVQIETAFPLEGTALTELVAALEKKFGIKLRPQVTVKPELIGGIRVAVGDEVLDTSVRTRLEQMKIALTAH